MTDKQHPAGDELSDARAVHVVELGEVEQDVRSSRFDQRIDGLAELPVTAGRQLARENENADPVLFPEIEFHRPARVLLVVDFMVPVLRQGAGC